MPVVKFPCTSPFPRELGSAARPPSTFRYTPVALMEKSSIGDARNVVRDVPLKLFSLLGRLIQSGGSNPHMRRTRRNSIFEIFVTPTTSLMRKETNSCTLLDPPDMLTFAL